MPAITPKEISALLSTYPFVAPKIKAIPTSGNLAFLIQDGKANYFLRLSPSGQRSRSKQEILAELELLQCLIRHGLPIPPLTQNKKGNYILSCRGHHGYIREFVTAKYKPNPNVKDIEEFGKCLGKMHTAIKGFQTKNPRLHVWDPETTARHFKQDKKVLLKSGLNYEFVTDLESTLASFSFPHSLPQGMIHEDLGKRHVLWQGSVIKGVIDFDRAYYGKLVLDLGQAIRGWCFVKDWTTWSQKNFEALLRGYESQRKLSKLEIKYLIPAIRFAISERCLAFALHAAYGENSKHAKLAIKDFYTLNRLLDKTKI